MITILILIAVVAIALIFEFINGFHDCANAIATVVSTKVLSPRHAVLFGAGLEFIGALTGTHVAKTIGAGIVNSDSNLLCSFGSCSMEFINLVSGITFQFLACTYRRASRSYNCKSRRECNTFYNSYG